MKHGWTTYTSNHNFYPDLALWATRLATMVFTVGYILPIFDNPYNSYYKVKMLCLHTSHLKWPVTKSISISNLKNTHWSLGLDGKCCHLSSPSTPETAPGFQLLLIMLIYPNSNDVNINEICCVSRFNLPGNSSTSSSRKTPLTTSSSGGRPCYKVKLCSWFSCSVILNPILFQFNLPLCCSHHIGKYFRIQYIWNIE